MHHAWASQPPSWQPEQVWFSEHRQQASPQYATAFIFPTFPFLCSALDKLTAREQTYLLYRYGFTDGIEHPLIGVALHFHLSESRTKKVEGEAMDSLRGKLPWWF